MPSVNNKKILLVEDEALLAVIEKRDLEKRGYAVVTVNTGEKAVEAVQNTPDIDLVLMDINLGDGIDGTEAAGQILNKVDLPIVFLSSHTEPEIVEKTEKITSYGYVVKSSSITVLDASIKMAFKLYDANNRLQESDIRQNAMLANISDVLVIIDADGITRYKSANIEKWFGWKPEELVGTATLDLIHPDDREAAQRFFEELTRTPGAAGTREFRYRCRDAHYAWIDITLVNLLDDPVIQGILGNYHDITARRQIEDEKFTMAEMLDVAPNSITVHDHHGRFLYANSKTSEIHGYDATGFSSVNLHQLDVPESEALMADRLELISKYGYASFEVSHFRKDGSIFPLEVFAKTVQWQGIPAILSIATDISERKKLEAKRDEYYRMLNATFNVIDSMLLVIDSDYHIILSNWKDHEWVPVESRTQYAFCYTCVKNLDAPCWNCPAMETFRDGKTRQYEDRNPVDGSYKEISIIPIFNERNEVEYVLENVRDTTRQRSMLREIELKNEELALSNEELRASNEEIRAANDELQQTETALRTSRRLLHEAQSLAKIGTWEWQLATGLVTWTDELYHIFGLDPDLRAPDFEDQHSLYTAGSWRQLKDAVGRALDSGEPYQLDLEVIRSDGSIRNVNVAGGALYDQSRQKIIGLHGLLQDITGRKQDEVKIKTLLSEKELVLREVHHRIKNTMNTMKSLLVLQADGLPDPGAVNALQDAARRMQSMELLYDRLYQTVSFSELSLQLYLPALIDEILTVFSASGVVTVRKHIEDIVLDAKRLQVLGIIVNELLTNSLKYAFPDKAKGVLSVSAVLVNDRVKVIVEDNGVGIPASVDFENSEGFGLLLIRTFADQLRGDIKLDRGAGTKTILTFAL